MKLEREPFTNAEIEVAVPVTDDLELQNKGGDDASKPDVTAQAPEYTKTDNTNIVDGIKYTIQPESYRVPAMVKIPGDFKSRVDVIAAMERRKITAVVEIALDRYLKLPTYEPRPFLPFSPKDCTVRMNFFVEKKVLDSLELRASVECRSLQDLIRRALLNYIEESAYDPQKLYGKTEQSVSGNPPEAIPEDSQ